MSTLRAGSYLKLLTDPEMDLMDVVAEETPVLRKKQRNFRRTSQMHLIRKDYPEDPGEVWSYDLLDLVDLASIEYECTHGERFADCYQRSVSFTQSPICRPKPPVTEVWAHMQSPDPEDWVYHAVMQPADTRYGLVCWDAGVWNELYPGYPGEPRHLIDDDAGGLDVDDELVRAYDTIRPAITSDTSLLVTLAELRDVKSLFSEPISFARKLVQLVGRKKAAKTTVAQVLTDPDIIPFFARSIAKGKLYTEFGLKQTKRDICSLFSTFWSLDRLVRDILKGTGLNTRHYSIPIYRESEDVFVHEFQDFNWIISKLWSTVMSRKFVVTMKYTTELFDAFGQPISPDDPELVKLGAAMDTLGLNMNPAILWDLVPFSFVVDYFIGIGDWLDRFKRSNLNLSFAVQDSCYSIKREFETRGTTLRWNSTWDGYERFPDHPLLAREDYIGGIDFELKTKEYTRRRFRPTLRMLSGLDAPDLRLPNWEQLKIGAALLTTNIPIFGKKG